MKRYFDYYTTIFTFLQKEGRGLGSHFLGEEGEFIEDLQCVRILHAMQSNGSDAGKVCWGILQKAKWPPNDSGV